MKVITHQQFVLTEDRQAITGVIETNEFICPECTQRLETAIQLHLCDCPEGEEN